ncbi:MAG TPA: D-2-hydroxyacid dehydrogenase [Planctomycetota bacterium]|nr:D-2-hydroxyacid dehydrogenase [Planctomycetota bacterium]
MPTIALVSKMTDAQRESVRKLCGGKVELLDFSSDRDGLAQRGGAAEIVWGRVKPEELPHLPKLRWIHATWTGIENMLYPELVARGIVLTNTRGQNANAMAEHIVGAVLYLARDFSAFYRASQAHQWKAETKIVKFAGSCALILGVGAIAKVLVPKLAALGVRLSGVNSSGQPAHGVAAMYTLATVRAHLKDVDWLISLMPATKHTRHCINEPFLRALKPGAGVINLSRGAVLDDVALLRCLHDNHLCGAVLDVTDPEPPPENSPLFGHPKILLTGHQSPKPFDETGVAFATFEHNLPLFLKGDWAGFQSRVDYEKGY